MRIGSSTQPDFSRPDLDRVSNLDRERTLRTAEHQASALDRRGLDDGLAWDRLRSEAGPSPGPLALGAVCASIWAFLRNSFASAFETLLEPAGARCAGVWHTTWTGATGAVIGVCRNVVEGLQDLGRGAWRTLTGRWEGLEQMGSGAFKLLVQTPVDAVVMTGASATSAVQTLVGLEPPGRSLTDREAQALRKIYGNSVDYDSIRIKEGCSGLMSLTGRTFVLASTVRVPASVGRLPAALLAHEVCHVWQHQNGGSDYVSEALWAQYVGDKYNVARGLGQGKSWAELNPEQQAQLVQDAYSQGCFEDPPGRLVVDGVDRTDELGRALTELRAGRGAP